MTSALGLTAAQIDAIIEANKQPTTIVATEGPIQMFAPPAPPALPAPPPPPSPPPPPDPAIARAAKAAVADNLERVLNAWDEDDARRAPSVPANDATTAGAKSTTTTAAAAAKTETTTTTTDAAAVNDPYEYDDGGSYDYSTRAAAADADADEDDAPPSGEVAVVSPPAVSGEVAVVSPPGDSSYASFALPKPLAALEPPPAPPPAALVDVDRERGVRDELRRSHAAVDAEMEKEARENVQSFFDRDGNATAATAATAATVATAAAAPPDASAAIVGPPEPPPRIAPDPEKAKRDFAHALAAMERGETVDDDLDAEDGASTVAGDARGGETRNAKNDELDDVLSGVSLDENARDDDDDDAAAAAAPAPEAARAREAAGDDDDDDDDDARADAPAPAPARAADDANEGVTGVTDEGRRDDGDEENRRRAFEILRRLDAKTF